MYRVYYYDDEVDYEQEFENLEEALDFACDKVHEQGFIRATVKDEFGCSFEFNSLIKKFNFTKVDEK